MFSSVIKVAQYSGRSSCSPSPPPPVRKMASSVPLSAMLQHLTTHIIYQSCYNIIITTPIKRKCQSCNNILPHTSNFSQCTPYYNTHQMSIILQHITTHIRPKHQSHYNILLHALIKFHLCCN